MRFIVPNLIKSSEQNQPLKLIEAFRFKAGEAMDKVTNMHLSSLEYVPSWKGFLILTSSENPRTVPHGNALWFLPVTSEDLKVDKFKEVSPIKVLDFDDSRQAEGLCVISEGQVGKAQTRKAQIAIVYDNDKSDKVPASLQLVNLVYEPEFRVKQALDDQ